MDYTTGTLKSITRHVVSFRCSSMHLACNSAVVMVTQSLICDTHGPKRLTVIEMLPIMTFSSM